MEDWPEEASDRVLGASVEVFFSSTLSPAGIRISALPVSTSKSDGDCRGEGGVILCERVSENVVMPPC